MAKPIASNKRDNEKKKQAKKLEKQKRKEERKTAGKTDSFDDMIAYVDENGMITDTPPEAKKEKINVEDIIISTPKKEEEEAPEYKGRVEHFNPDKGYGFIKDLKSTEKYFFHISSAPSDIQEGKIVAFELQRGTRGMNAVNISYPE